MTDGVVDCRHDLFRTVTQHAQRFGDRLVDDFKVSAAGQLFEFDQREVRLDPRGVTIHNQADRTRRRDDCRLGVAVPVKCPLCQSVVPAAARAVNQAFVSQRRHINGTQRNRFDRQLLVAVDRAMCGAPVITNDAQHVIGVVCITFEGAQFTRHRCRRCI